MRIYLLDKRSFRLINILIINRERRRKEFLIIILISLVFKSFYELYFWNICYIWLVEMNLGINRGKICYILNWITYELKYDDQ